MVSNALTRIIISMLDTFIYKNKTESTFIELTYGLLHMFHVIKKLTNFLFNGYKPSPSPSSAQFPSDTYVVVWGTLFHYYFSPGYSMSFNLSEFIQTEL